MEEGAGKREMRTKLQCPLPHQQALLPAGGPRPAPRGWAASPSPLRNEQGLVQLHKALFRGRTAAAPLNDWEAFHATSPRPGTGCFPLPGPATYSRP